MSTLSIHDLQGLGTYSNTVRVPSGHKFQVEGNLKIPTWTTATRPSTGLEDGIVGYNATISTIEIYYNGGWRSVAGFSTELGQSPSVPATSAVQILQANPNAPSGIYYIDTPNAGVQRVYCDMDTQDQYGEAGYMLVASFQQSTLWTVGSYPSGSSPLISPNANFWSSCFGDYTINQFRVTVTPSLNSLGSQSLADWYYYYSNGCLWKEVWSYESGSNKNYMNDTSGSNSGNINASFHSGWPQPSTRYADSSTNGNITRICTRGFNWAYNNKWSYQVAQRWNSLSDSSGGGQQSWPDFWTALTRGGVNISTYDRSDGTLAILPQGSDRTAAGHDCGENNCKIGRDDATDCTIYGTSATYSTQSVNPGGNGQTGTTGQGDQPAQFWIK